MREMMVVVVLGVAPILTLHQTSNHRLHFDHHRHQSKLKSALNAVNPSSTNSSSLVSSFSSRISNTSSTTLQLDSKSSEDSNLRGGEDRDSVREFAELASDLAEDGRLDEFLLVVEGVVSLGIDVSRFLAALDLRIVAKGIGGVISKRRVWDVVEFLRRTEDLGISALKLFDRNCKQILVDECRRIVEYGKVEEVVELMEALAGFEFRVKEIVDPHVIINICVEKRAPELAVRYASIFTHAPILFCTIINEFGKRKDFRSAFTAFDTSNQKLNEPNMYAYRSMIDVCGLCGKTIKSRVIYEDLLFQKVTPNIFVYNSLMNVNSDDLGYTLTVYKDMQNLGVMADMASFNVLLKACARAGRVDLAQDIYREVKELELKGILKLDVFTYCTIIKVFADAKLWQMALMIKEDMIQAGVKPNTVTWSSLISACANAGLVEQCMLLFEEMLETGCEPNSYCYNILIHACVEACQYDRAFRLFNSWKKNELQWTTNKGNIASTDSIDDDNSYRENKASISSFISNSQQLTAARKKSFSRTTTTYNTLMKACGTDYHRAKALMDEMKTAGLYPDQISWSIMMDICGALGDLEGALQMMTSMRQAGMRPDVIAYTTAIKICVENKRFNLAFSLFEEMKRYRVQPNLVTYNTLLRARSRYGFVHEVQQCLAIYLDMRRAGYESNDHYLKELIEEWCEGIIQDDSKKHSQLNNRSGSDKVPSQSLLLEKLASHLDKNNAEMPAIDLQGHSKVEARIIVLAILRMIKENYISGVPVKDDMLIILGTTSATTDLCKHESDVGDAVIKLLRNELGLDISTQGFVKYPATHTLELNSKDKRPNDRLHLDAKTPTRRPTGVQRIKVTRKSLNQWLQRRKG